MRTYITTALLLTSACGMFPAAKSSSNPGSDAIKTIYECTGTSPDVHYKAAVYANGDKLITVSYRNDNRATDFYAAADTSTEAETLQTENSILKYAMTGDGKVQCTCLQTGCNRGYNATTGANTTGPDSWVVSCTKTDY